MDMSFFLNGFSKLETTHLHIRRILDTDSEASARIYNAHFNKTTMEKPSVEQIKQIVRNLTESDDPVVHKATVEK